MEDARAVKKAFFMLPLTSQNYHLHSLALVEYI